MQHLLLKSKIPYGSKSDNNLHMLCYSTSMNINTTGIICAVEPHGERGVVIKTLTPDVGLLAGYVRSGQSRRLRPLLMPGNTVSIAWQARTDSQLGTMQIELEHTRAQIMLDGRTKAMALAWLSALTATVLPERMAYPVLHEALLAWLDVLEYADDDQLWAEALVKYELHLLSCLGFGLDLERCAVTGHADDLIYVSPKSGRAVSRDAGRLYAKKLLPLPRFVQTTAQTRSTVNDQTTALLDGFQLSGYFLEQHVLNGASRHILNARQRLIEALKSRETDF